MECSVPADRSAVCCDTIWNTDTVAPIGAGKTGCGASAVHQWLLCGYLPTFKLSEKEEYVVFCNLTKKSELIALVSNNKYCIFELMLLFPITNIVVKLLVAFLKLSVNKLAKKEILVK